VMAFKGLFRPAPGCPLPLRWFEGIVVLCWGAKLK
jgi:hypothetical protein